MMDFLTITDVGPRDGLQSQKTQVFGAGSQKTGIVLHQGVTPNVRVHGLLELSGAQEWLEHASQRAVWHLCTAFTST